MTERYSRAMVAVPDGPVSVGRWRGDGPPVVVIHGISSTHLLWLWAAHAGPELELVAPDLRGRGDSFGASGPYGVARHRDDVLAVMDQLGIERAMVVGMSMGGFVATALVEQAPDRVSALVLVDGGAPMSPPAGGSEQGLEDRMARTVQTFSGIDDYKKLFCAGVGTLLDQSDPLLDQYLGYDLVPAEDGVDFVVRLAPQAVLQDAMDVFGGTTAADRMAALSTLDAPISFLHAEWSIGAGTPPAYPVEVVEDWRARLPGMRTRLVPGLDHAGTIMSARGAAEVVAEVRALAAAGS